jgi:hypothetical protein
MYLYFLVATGLVFGFGIGTSVTGSWLLAALSAAVVAGFAVLGGIFGTMQMRQRLGLMQTGRLVQWASFAFAAFVGLELVGFLLGGTLSVFNPFCSAAAIFAIAFVPALLFGEVPWRGRTWLPKRMPRK